MRRNEEIDCNIKLDVCGVVQESQCECGAGMGPEAHCKQSYMCHTLCTNNERRGNHMFLNLYTEVVDISPCKKHIGSPVNMEHLKLRSIGSLQRALGLDPSPADDMPDAECENLFRNVIVNMNVQEISMLKMSPRQCPCCWS